MFDLGIMGQKFWKTIVTFKISTLTFAKNESLNFGIGSAFSKALSSPFSERPGVGAGLPYDWG